MGWPPFSVLLVGLAGTNHRAISNIEFSSWEFILGICGRRGTDEGGRDLVAGEAHLQGGALRGAPPQGTGRQEQLTRCEPRAQQPLTKDLPPGQQPEYRIHPVMQHYKLKANKPISHRVSHACSWSIEKGSISGLVEVLLIKCTASISSFNHFVLSPASVSLCIT